MAEYIRVYGMKKIKIRMQDSIVSELKEYKELHNFSWNEVAKEVIEFHKRKRSVILNHGRHITLFDVLDDIY